MALDELSCSDQAGRLGNIEMSFDRSINYAFQQNAIATQRQNLLIQITTEPILAEPVEIRLQSIDAEAEFRVAQLELKLSHHFLAGLNEKVAGWPKIEVVENGASVWSRTEAISLLARNEWCGLASPCRADGRQVCGDLFGLAEKRASAMEEIYLRPRASAI